MVVIPYERALEPLVDQNTGIETEMLARLLYQRAAPVRIVHEIIRLFYGLPHKLTAITEQLGRHRDHLLRHVTDRNFRPLDADVVPLSGVSLHQHLVVADNRVCAVAERTCWR